MNEEWRPFPEYPGYFVSSFGRIKGPRGIRKLATSHDGYVTVDIRRKGHHQFRVGRIVLKAFVGPSNGLECSHRDNNRQNNRLDNLLWETRKENEDRKDFFNTRPRGEFHVQAKLSLADVEKAEEMKRSGISLQVIADHFSVTKQAIFTRLKRKQDREARGVEGLSKE